MQTRLDHRKAQFQGKKLAAQNWKSTTVFLSVHQAFPECLFDPIHSSFHHGLNDNHYTEKPTT